MGPEALAVKLPPNCFPIKVRCCSAVQKNKKTKKQNALVVGMTNFTMLVHHLKSIGSTLDTAASCDC
jgi:hypothetical protein